jgi:hypothetical protein
MSKSITARPECGNKGNFILPFRMQKEKINVEMMREKEHV